MQLNKTNRRTNNYIPILPIIIHGPGHLARRKYGYIILVPAIPTETALFNRRHPYVDRTAGANIKSWINVLNEALNKFDSKTTFIYGHAATAYEVTGNADDLKAFRDYLGNVLKFVEGEIKTGKTKEEILKATGIPGADQWKGDGIQRPLTAAWEELTTK
jgi:hypothetical protein